MTLPNQRRGMENHQSSALLASIGGEPLANSGFETETPVLEDELTFETAADDQEGEDQ
jgi:hypothetical protein